MTPRATSYRCAICAQPITGEDPHTDPATGEDVHWSCCPSCNPGDETEGAT